MAPERASFGRRAALAGLVGAACAVASVAYVAKRASERRETARTEAPPSREHVELLQRVRSRSHVLFVEPRGVDRPRIAFAPLDATERASIPGGRVVTSIEAERVYAAGARLVCLGPHPAADGTNEHGAFVLDASLAIERRIPLAGVPSRVRASRDGSIAAVTTFVTGDSYAGAGFSTRTWVFDLAGELAPADVERWPYVHGGMPIDSPDLNLWGVTFADPPTRCYATARSGGVVRLLEIDVAARTGHTVRARVECPSLAPDGKRIAFKTSTETMPVQWRLAVLDLATTAEHRIAGEERSVDDQVEWLDDRRVLYAIGSDVWVVGVDDAEPARLFLADARSPCVVRR